MSSYVVDSFSDALSQEDVLELFGRLQSSAGSLAKAAELCDLERKTIYDWQRTGYVKLPTKRKVLKALLEHLSKATLGFITKRTYDRAQEALRIYLSTLYEQSVTESDPDQFLRMVGEFESALNQYKSLAQKLSKDELPQMLYELSRHAQSLGTEWRTGWMPQTEEKPSLLETNKSFQMTTMTNFIFPEKDSDYRINLVRWVAALYDYSLFTMQELTKEVVVSEMKQSTAATIGISPDQRFQNQWQTHVQDSVQQIRSEPAAS